MLTHPTHERLITLGLTGMAKALEEQRRSSDLDALSFEERVGLLVDREAAERDTKRLSTRLKFAALRQSACVEDMDLRTPRGIDRAVFARLVGGDSINRDENLLITGATGLAEADRLRPRSQSLPRQSARSNIIACRACSRRLPSHAATAATAACSEPWARSTPHPRRLGASVLNSPERRDLLESLMIATVTPRPSLPARSPSNIGTTL